MQTIFDDALPSGALDPARKAKVDEVSQKVDPHWYHSGESAFWIVVLHGTWEGLIWNYGIKFDCGCFHMEHRQD